MFFIMMLEMRGSDVVINSIRFVHVDVFLVCIVSLREIKILKILKILKKYLILKIKIFYIST